MGFDSDVTRAEPCCKSRRDTVRVAAITVLFDSSRDVISGPSACAASERNEGTTAVRPAAQMSCTSLE